MALSVREYSQVAYGTPSRPLPLSLRLDVPEGSRVQRSFVLGFEGCPSSQWFAFVAPRPLEIRLTRSSDDPEASSVGVAICASDRRSIEGVNGNSGIGDWIELAAGNWLIGASLFSTKTVAIDLTIEIRPRQARMVGLGRELSTASLAQQRHMLLAVGDDFIESVGLVREPVLAGYCEDRLVGIALHSPPADLPIRLQGSGQESSGASLSAAPFAWADERGRLLSNGDVADPLNDNRTLYRGEGMYYMSRLTTLQGAPILLSGYTGALRLHDHRRLLDYGVFDLDTASLANGVLAAPIPSQATATLPGEVWMDIELVSPNGRSSYPLQGFWTVQEGYTR